MTQKNTFVLKVLNGCIQHFPLVEAETIGEALKIFNPKFEPTLGESFPSEIKKDYSGDTRWNKVPDNLRTVERNQLLCDFVDMCNLKTASAAFPPRFNGINIASVFKINVTGSSNSYMIWQIA